MTLHDQIDDVEWLEECCICQSVEQAPTGGLTAVMAVWGEVKLPDGRIMKFDRQDLRVKLVEKK